MINSRGATEKSQEGGAEGGALALEHWEARSTPPAHSVISALGSWHWVCPRSGGPSVTAYFSSTFASRGLIEMLIFSEEEPWCPAPITSFLSAYCFLPSLMVTDAHVLPPLQVHQHLGGRAESFSSLCALPWARMSPCLHPLLCICHPDTGGLFGMVQPL